MRVQSAILLGLCLCTALGCTRVQHRFQPYRAVGTALPVEVWINYKADEVVSGTVYHRSPGSWEYEATPLQLRAGQLWAVLPTEHLQPQETVEYYIDVNKDGRLHALGSPGSPYVVTFMDQDQLILSSLRDMPLASDAAHEVRIVLAARNNRLDHPHAVYQIPGVPGEIRAPMEADGHGSFQIIVPPSAVRPGTWKYAIEFELNGSGYRMPEQGYRSFVVEPVAPRKVAAEDAP